MVFRAFSQIVLNGSTWERVVTQLGLTEFRKSLSTLDSRAALGYYLFRRKELRLQKGNSPKKMTIEERLAELQAGKSCAHTWDQPCAACLATQLAGLLREYQKHSCLTHSYACPAAEEVPGPFDPSTCDCGTMEFESRVLAILDGGPDEHE